MGGFGVLTLVATTTGSFAAAGTAVGALGLGCALGGPLVGALADRYGQRLVGLAAAVADAFAYTALLVAAFKHAPIAVIAAAAALAGFANPQIGSLVRVRWAVLLGERAQQRLLPTALSYEGVADEMSYIAGPALIGVLALTGYPSVPLIGAITLLLLCGTAFALHPAAPPVLRVPSSTARGQLPRDLIGLIAAMVCIGVVFGATQTGITALAESIGRSGVGGLVYAVMGLGSVLAGLLTAVLPARFGLTTRYVAFAGALLVGSVALLVVGSLGTAMVALAILGAAVAPYLITVYALAEKIAPTHRAGAVMTLVTSGVVTGGAGGAALAGMLADSYGYPGAFAVPACASLLAVVLALASRRRLARLVVPVPILERAPALSTR
jgi:MFS family permease